MPKVYLVRHPRTFHNMFHVFQPDNAPLCAEGEKQSRALGVFFSKIDIGRIYSSEAVRTHATAQAISARQKKPVAIEIVPALNERRYGQFVGKTFQGASGAWPGLVDPTWHSENDEIFKAVGGEVFGDFFKRVQSFFSETLSAVSSDAVVVSHSLVNKLLLVLFQGKPLEEMDRIPKLKNACIIEVELSGGSATVIRINYTDHLVGV